MTVVLSFTGVEKMTVRRFGTSSPSLASLYVAKTTLTSPLFRSANTRARRSQWKADNVALQEVKIDGQVHMVPRRLVKAAQLGLVDVKQF